MLRQEPDPRIWGLLSRGLPGPSQVLSMCRIQGPGRLPAFPPYTLRPRWEPPEPSTLRLGVGLDRSGLGATAW